MMFGLAESLKIDKSYCIWNVENKVSGTVRNKFLVIVF